jgi:phage terminase large subunit
MKDPRTLVIHSTFKDNPFCPTEQKTKILSYQPVEMSEVVVSELIDLNKALKYDCVENNLNLNEKQLNELRRCQQNEAKKSANAYKWQVYGLGDKAENPNRILHFEPIPLQKYQEIKSTIYYGVDWGAVDPWGVVEIKYNDGCLYVHELNYLSENETRQRLTITELNQIGGEDEGLVSWLFKKLDVSKDSFIICDTNRPNKIRQLRTNGFKAFPAPNKGILDGIDLLNDLSVYYTDCSENLAYEQENYSRKVDRTGYVLDEPIDKDNHCIDPIRYVALFLVKLGVIKKI